jgi:hypothetical protein
MRGKGRAGKFHESSRSGKRGKGGAARQHPGKTALARELVDLLVAALPGRRVSVAADAAYRGKPCARCPPTYVSSPG